MPPMVGKADELLQVPIFSMGKHKLFTGCIFSIISSPDSILDADDIGIYILRDGLMSKNILSDNDSITTNNALGSLT